jgi:hypothetical protein
MGHAYIILARKSEGKGFAWTLGVGERMISKWILEKQDMRG